MVFFFPLGLFTVCFVDASFQTREETLFALWQAFSAETGLSVNAGIQLSWTLHRPAGEHGEDLPLPARVDMDIDPRAAPETVRRHINQVMAHLQYKWMASSSSPRLGSWQQ